MLIILSLCIEIGKAGASPIKILQRKFYATLIFKHPDWLINLSSQSECLKYCVQLDSPLLKQNFSQVCYHWRQTNFIQLKHNYLGLNTNPMSYLSKLSKRYTTIEPLIGLILTFMFLKVLNEKISDLLKKIVVFATCSICSL